VSYSFCEAQVYCDGRYIGAATFGKVRRRCRRVHGGVWASGTFTLSTDSANVRALLEALCSPFTLREMDRDDS